MSSGTSHHRRGLLARNHDREVQVHLTSVDLVVLVACSLGALVLMGPGRWAPGALRNAGLFALMAAGPLVLRTLEASFPKQRWLTTAADWWLLPVAVLTHGWLSPVVDTLNPILKDAQLVAADQKLFGFQAAVELAHRVPPWLNDILLICYYGHFVWPLVLGVALYRRARGVSSDFSEYLTGLGMLFLFNYAAYALVPAVGPRYFLIGSFDGPLQGAMLTPVLDSLMRAPRYARDCFPSGHTGTTLLVLFYAWRFHRPLFWIMLGPGIGLVIATLAGRFHYATDLVCAVPLVMVVAGLALGLCRAARQREGERAARSVPVDAIVRP
ncbi:phosphatase PAP2 family protein [Pyxidicoccus sp. MSG2]|uniref:phosphatase PAP2 family protein n=1 Tax=Pyxidicoccus sp. MSG2 TaxID=2996790 RepID=UPI002271DD40|nr:phosphatase PAP2 family protein [Pyxidicoccus sp. MSG2]MCY1023162.1 phosphatase PAP2 family protein [Pyxidicoccus sp. MSG2]